MKRQHKSIREKPALPFQQHRSPELVALFKSRPYQGQDPKKASVLFLSSDANYSPKITGHNFFEYILRYHNNSVAFWKCYKCHHPFLLPCYPFNKTKDGVPFHRNFSKLGLGPEHAKHISFVELLNIPTQGSKSKSINSFYQLLDLEHLKDIESLLFEGNHKICFISRGVLQDIKKIKKTYPPLFNWLEYDPASKEQYSQSINGNTIREIYHFSSSQIHGQLDEIRRGIDLWLGTVND
jgi:hypothetical protein